MNRSPSKFSSSGSSLTFSPGKTPGQVYERSRCYLLFVTWLCVCIGCDHLSSSSSPWSFFFLVALVICTWDNLGLSWSCSCWRIIFNGIYNFGSSSRLDGVSSSENVASSSSWKVDVTVDFLETFFFFDDLISALSAISLIACIKCIIGGDVRS